MAKIHGLGREGPPTGGLFCCASRRRRIPIRSGRLVSIARVLCLMTVRPVSVSGGPRPNTRTSPGGETDWDRASGPCAVRPALAGRER